jgi:hypothetical protein
MSSMVKDAITELSASSNVTAIDIPKMLNDSATGGHQTLNLMFGYTEKTLSVVATGLYFQLWL